MSDGKQKTVDHSENLPGFNVMEIIPSEAYRLAISLATKVFPSLLCAYSVPPPILSRALPGLTVSYLMSVSVWRNDAEDEVVITRTVREGTIWPSPSWWGVAAM